MKRIVATAVIAVLACLSTACEDATGTGTPSGKWSSVSVGNSRSCALAEGGVAYCWGLHAIPPTPTGGAGSAAIPTRVPGLQTFTQVSTATAFGRSTTCGLTGDGAGYCWGGTSGANRIAVPRRMSSPSLTTLSADFNYACGLTAAGEAYCWGDGLDIASPYYDGSALPSLLEAHLTSLTVGSEMACGIDTTGATACLHRHLLTHWEPTPTADGFTSVVPGGGFRCGLRSDGQALCSTAISGPGTGGSWEMVGDLTPVAAPQPLVQLSAEGSRVCGITAEGLTYCWAVSVSSPFGGPGGITTPVAVGGEQRFVQISVASTHACGLTADGEIYCWGDNGAGELGNGSIGGSSDTPVRVSDPA